MTMNIELLPKEKVFRDPIHDHIHVQHRVILDLINSREMQRLRRIKQTGATSFTFHGAEHSRFGHSLGVYEITRRICDKFERNFPSQVAGDGLWDDSERLVALCAALLHDIGHGPYSHAFEKIFDTFHEQITIDIITSPETEVNHILQQVSHDFPNKVASVIQKTYPNPQVVQIISSQIDADRMDYLLRDAFFTGVDYGKFDISRILRVMRPYEDGIAFELAGMHAVEDYILSRYQMYMQVYFHPVSRGMEVILHHLLQRAADDYQANQYLSSTNAGFLIPFFEKNWTLEDYLRLDDGVVNTYFNHWQYEEDPILSDLAKRFLNRHPFKSVKLADKNDEDYVQQLTDLIEEVGFNPLYYTAINDSFDLPYDLYNPNVKHPRTQIELIDTKGNFVELSQLSDIVKAITGKHNGDRRLFFPREMVITDNKKEDMFELIYQQFKECILHH